MFLFYLFTYISSRRHNLTIKSHDDMMKYLSKQRQEEFSIPQDKEYGKGDENGDEEEDSTIYFCVGEKYNRCQYVSQNKVPEHNIIDENQIAGFLNSEYKNIVFYIIKSFDILISADNFFFSSSYSFSFIGDTAVKSSITVYSDYYDTPILIDTLVLQDVSFNVNISSNKLINISKLILKHSELLNNTESSGGLFVSNVITDFTTIVSSQNTYQDFFTKIENLTIDGENVMTTIYYKPDYKYQISNVGSFLDQVYDVQYGDLPSADYYYFITNRRLDLEADYQMPVVNPQYNQSGIFFTSNYPYLQFTQSSSGLWTVEAQSTIEIYLYDGRRLTINGNFDDMNITYFHLQDGWGEGFNLYELNENQIVIIVISCVLTVIIFGLLYYVTVGRSKKKYKSLEYYDPSKPRKKKSS